MPKGVEYRASPGEDISNAAKAMLKLCWQGPDEEDGQIVWCDFNGTIFQAYPDDDETDIVTRWETERDRVWNERKRSKNEAILVIRQARKKMLGFNKSVEVAKENYTKAGELLAHARQEFNEADAEYTVAQLKFEEYLDSL